MIALILSISLLLWVLVKHLKQFYRMESYMKNVKSTYPIIPLLGNAWSLMGKSSTEVSNDFVQFANANGTPIKTYLGTILSVILDEPEDLRMILNSQYCCDKPFVLDFIPIRLGLFSIRLIDVWKPIRKHLNAAFNPKVLQSFVPIFNEKVKTMFEKMDDQIGKGEFDILPYINMSTLDAICATTMRFEVKTRLHLGYEFLKSKDAIICAFSARFMRPWIYLDSFFKWTKLYREQQSHLINMGLLTNKIFSENKRHYSTSNNNQISQPVGNNPPIVIEKLLKLHASGEFNEQMVEDQIKTILIGGIDTTSATVSFVLLMLAIHTDIQRRVFSELRTVYRTQEEETTHEHMQQLTYLEQVIKETMRLFPVVPFPMRTSNNDIAITKCTLPKDAFIIISIFSMHRRRDIWGDDADQFNPDHFLPANMCKRHPLAFIPFSFGQRNCIGHRYAMMSMKVVLSAVLRRYKFSTSLRMSDINLKFEMMLRLANKHMLQIERRAW